MEALWYGNENDSPGEPNWGLMIFISLMFHAVFFSAIFFVPQGLPSRPVGVPVYEVDLVEMPGRPHATPSKRPAKASTLKKPKISEKTTPVKRISTPKKDSKPVVIAKRTLDTKKSLETTPPLSKKHMEQALAEIEEKIKTKEEEEGHLEQAISELENRTQEEPAGNGGGKGGRAGIRPDNPIELYVFMVRETIRQNWSYPVADAQLEGKRDIEAIFELRVSGDGTVLGHQFQKKSSDGLFDQSVQKAIERTASVPPIPEWYLKSKGINEDTFIVYFNLKELLSE